MGIDYYILEHFVIAVVFFVIVPVAIIAKNDNIGNFVGKRIRNFSGRFSGRNRVRPENLEVGNAPKEKSLV